MMMIISKNPLKDEFIKEGSFESRHILSFCHQKKNFATSKGGFLEKRDILCFAIKKMYLLVIISIFPPYNFIGTAPVKIHTVGKLVMMSLEAESKQNSKEKKMHIIARSPKQRCYKKTSQSYSLRAETRSDGKIRKAKCSSMNFGHSPARAPVAQLICYIFHYIITGFFFFFKEQGILVGTETVY